MKLKLACMERPLDRSDRPDQLRNDTSLLLSRRLRFISQWSSMLYQSSLYCVVGATGVVVNMLIFHILREWIHLDLIVSSAVAVETAIVNNFIWNDIWTFRDVSRQQQGWRARLKRFYRFNVVCLFGLLLNVLIVTALARNSDINESLAMLLGIAVVTILNFTLNSKVSWRE